MFENLDISAILGVLFGSGSVIYMIVQHVIKKKEKQEELSVSEVEDLKNKIGDLEDKIHNLSEERLQLSIKAARLEERLLVNAKNRVKRSDRNHHDDLGLGH